MNFFKKNFTIPKLLNCSILTVVSGYEAGLEESILKLKYYMLHFKQKRNEHKCTKIYKKNKISVLLSIAGSSCSLKQLWILESFVKF